MNIENLSTLKIHRLTRAQFERETAAGNMDETAIYLTPEEKYAVPVEASKLDDLRVSGLYAVYPSVVIPNGYAGAAIVRVESCCMETEGNNIVTVQTAYSPMYPSSYCTRFGDESGWGEWEWENPPMKLGEEYRTTERCGDKSVYVKHVKLDEEPTEECLIGTNVRAIRAFGYMVGDGGYAVTLPFRNSSEEYYLNVRSIGEQDDTELYASVYSPQFEQGWDCYAQVWYIKK